jgi:hypothetical protein
MTTISLQTYCVRNSDGSIDLDGTVAKFSGDLLRFQTERELEAEAVGEAVNAVFDQYPGAKLNMPAVTSMALQRLNVQPENFKTLTEKVQGYIRDRAGERDSGAPFHIGKGKGGGVCRWADQPEPKPES